MIDRSLSSAPRAALRRWSWLAVAVPLLSACGSSATTKPGASGTSTSFKTTFSAQAHTDIDILFMIDNSSETSCPDGGLALTVSPDPSSTAEPVATSIECQICQPGSTAPGC